MRNNNEVARLMYKLGDIKQHGQSTKASRAYAWPLHILLAL